MKIIQTLGWPADELNVVGWSKDGGSIVTGSDDGSIRVWTEINEEWQVFQVFQLHEQPVKALVCTPKKLLIAGSSDCSISIWDLGSGALIKRIFDFQDWVRGVSASPDGSTLAVVSADQTLHLYSLDNFELIRKSLAHDDIIRSVTWSVDGRKLATVCAGGNLKIWDSGDLTVIANQEFTFGLTCVVWLSGNESLAVCGIDRAISIVDVSSMDTLQVLEGHKDTVLSLSLNEETNLLASGSADRTIKLWDLGSNRCVQTAEGHRGSVRGLCWSPDNRKLATISTDRSLRLWHVFRVTGKHQILCDSKNMARRDWVRSAAYHSPSSIVSLGMDDRAVEIFDVSKSTRKLMRMEASTTISYKRSGKATRVVEKRRQRTEEWIRCIACPLGARAPMLEKKHNPLSSERPLHGFMAYGSDDSGVRLLNLGLSTHIRDCLYEGHVIDEFENGRGGTPSCLAFDQVGELIAIGMDTNAYIWSPFKGVSQERAMELSAHTDNVIALDWDKRSNLLFSSALDYKVLCWNISAGSYSECDPSDTEIVCLAVSPDNRVLAGAGSDGCAHFWSTETLQLIKSVSVHNEQLSQVMWSEDSRHVVAASRGGCIKVIEFGSWEVVAQVSKPSTPRVNLDVAICDSKKSIPGELDLDGKASLRTVNVSIAQPKHRFARNIFKAAEKSSAISAKLKVFEGIFNDQRGSQHGPLKIFISYAREDRNHAQTLYRKLKRAGFEPWLDEEDALPGIEWREVLPEQVKNSDIVLICLSETSTRKKGYLQKEIRVALEAAQERPLGDVYIVPVRFEECEIPNKLSQYHAANLYQDNGWELLMATLVSKGTVKLSASERQWLNE